MNCMCVVQRKTTTVSQDANARTACNNNINVKINDGSSVGTVDVDIATYEEIPRGLKNNKFRQFFQ